MKVISAFRDILQSLGIVFGDIGTSPIYTISTVFAFIPPTVDNVMGITSLVIWTLILLVTIQYAWLAMSLATDDRAEGGTIILRKHIMPLVKSSYVVGMIVTVLTILGISFFIGDGVITPAISILSAVEGLNLIPSFYELTQSSIMGIAIVIAMILFALQRRGVERVSRAFGPIMLVWFILLGTLGVVMITRNPAILWAVNPMYALTFLWTQKFIGILLLSKVILCATGGEALYADMGHLGRKPIVRAWSFVFIMLVLTYMGQGAFLLETGETHKVFYELILFLVKPLYVPLLFLSIMATVIASQASIVGIFSIVYQGITTHMLPRLHVEYTSRRFMSQIYIPLINTFLLICVLLAILKFKYSENVATAYGLAASFTMTITAILLTMVYALKRWWFRATIAAFLILINCVYLYSGLFKIPYGGYVSLLIACIPFSITCVYMLGRRRLNRLLRELPQDIFVEKYTELSQKIPRINGTAVFMSRSVKKISKYIVHTMFTNNIMYEENIIVSVKTMNEPFGVKAQFTEDLAPGLRVFKIELGYLEPTNLEKIFNTAEIHPKVIFYGTEDITTSNLFWQIYIVIKKLTPSFVRFYKLQRTKLHGVMVRVEM